MNLSKFTLVHRGPQSSKALKDWTVKINQDLPQASSALSGLSPKYRQLKSALLTSVNLAVVGPYPTDEASAITEKIRAVSTELQRQTSVTTVGIWDLGSRVARLPKLIEKLNVAQPTFVFFEVQAGIPAGLVSQPERIIAWAKSLRKRVGKRLTKSDREEMLRNTIADDFSPRAESVRNDLGIDYLVGVTPSMIAWEGPDGPHWNYISTSSGRTLLASTQDFRSFADTAGRPFEVLVGCAVIGQLLTAMFEGRGLGFHPNTGCLFDFNEDRVSFANVAKNPHIEKSCMDLIPPSFRPSAQKLMEVLANYPK